MKKLDKIDIAILDSLQKDGRVSNTKLAEQLTLSEASCWRKQKYLEDTKIIEGYQAILNRKKLGLGVMVFVQIVCSQHDEKSTKEFEYIIQSSPNVLTCHNITGEADFLLQVVAKDLDDYSRFVEKVLRKLPAIISISSSISLRELKTTNKLPLD
ncbi:MAG: Lrp/AsnC family transcriptional regulator [Acinetobacter sp.]|uniref:Lrp/AsnC family transcriptional regulator n=1 Tax=Acinetobacter TaxID=469 RepID=UPI0006470B1D|nr:MULTISPECIES: Lrp/AsnC family transcriptional regulator [Acinetobacter]MCW3177813.1 Lrp/AsnC family transcriptional regulator [Acinetobacter baumannii]MDU6101524.1 Lrp/AsnC family transcriptional regulator [Acinetobacter sp.]RZH03318.1 Lrp/AsnC family transcriptional regulator [Acinetobacter pittii]